MKRAVLLLSLAFTALPGLSAQSLQTLRTEFTRTTRTGGSVETVHGTLFFKAPERVILVVREPVSQWVVFETGSMLLWYPESGKAWRFSEKKSRSLAFASLFVGVPLADFGLSSAGFTLTGSQNRDGTLVTLWQPPKSLARSIGAATVTRENRQPRSLDVTDPRGRPLAHVRYTGFVPFGGQAIPSNIELTQVTNGTTVSEEVSYSGHQFNCALPPDVALFRLPEGVTPTETEW